MIEYFTFKHNGESESYKDEVYLTVVPSVTVAVFYGSNKENKKHVRIEFQRNSQMYIEIYESNY